VTSTSPSDADPFHLDRFVRAQEGVYEQAIKELRSGRKTSHWIWFVFPQLAGLGRSATAARFAITGLPEARAYLAHPVLGVRLAEASAAALEAPAPSVEALLGSIDAVKLRSSMTLFMAVAPAAQDPADGTRHDPFRAVLDRWYGGVPDARTLELLGE
jgi:uncharacterized protein (DUF1810 family)